MLNRPQLGALRYTRRNRLEVREIVVYTENCQFEEKKLVILNNYFGVFIVFSLYIKPEWPNFVLEISINIAPENVFQIKC